MSVYLLTNEELVAIEDVDGSPSLQMLQKLVGGYIEVVTADNMQIIVNEEGMLENLPVNFGAFAMLGMHLLGNVVLLTGENILK